MAHITCFLLKDSRTIKCLCFFRKFVLHIITQGYSTSRQAFVVLSGNDLMGRVPSNLPLIAVTRQTSIGEHVMLYIYVCTCVHIYISAVGTNLYLYTIHAGIISRRRRRRRLRIRLHRVHRETGTADFDGKFRSPEDDDDYELL